jgi:hypothetical protein
MKPYKKCQLNKSTKDLNFLILFFSVHSISIVSIWVSFIQHDVEIYRMIIILDINYNRTYVFLKQDFIT